MGQKTGTHGFWWGMARRIGWRGTLGWPRRVLNRDVKLQKNYPPIYDFLTIKIACVLTIYYTFASIFKVPYGNTD